MFNDIYYELLIINICFFPININFQEPVNMFVISVSRLSRKHKTPEFIDAQLYFAVTVEKKKFHTEFMILFIDDL